MYNPDLGPDPQHWHKKSRKNTEHITFTAGGAELAIRGDLTHHAPPWWTKVQQNKMLTESKEKERDREREGGWLLAIYRGYHWPPSHTHAHASSHKVRQYQADKRGINKRRQPPKEKKKAGVETIC